MRSTIISSRIRDIIDTFHSLLTEKCYSDPEYRTLAFDVVFYISRYYREEQWFPTDYTPGISVEQWQELIKDKEVFNTTAMTIMKRFLDYGGTATCLQLSEKYGNTVSYYNMGSQRLAERVHKKTSCPMMPREESNSWLWPVLFVGRNATEKEKGLYIWKLRDELHKALQQADLSEYPLYSDGKEPSGDAWLPLESEYTPGLSKEDWMAILTDREIVGPVWGGLLAAFFLMGGEATCSQIAWKSTIRTHPP